MEHASILNKATQRRTQRRRAIVVRSLSINEHREMTPFVDFHCGLEALIEGALTMEKSLLLFGEKADEKVIAV